ncbi:NUDIX hydrolase, partial [Streptomyces sparsus]
PPVAAAAVVRDGRLLLVRRREPEGELRWQLPAGKVLPGEAVHRAAVRETFEETELRVFPLRLLGARRHPLTGRRLDYVACLAVSGTATVAAPAEITDVAWCTPAEVAALVPAGLHPPVLTHLHAAPGREPRPGAAGEP